MRLVPGYAVACTAILAAMTTGIANRSRASDFELREGSADWMANAFAGDTAKAHDAYTAWSNPPGWSAWITARSMGQ
jgi:long-chain fatty acid transport protein